MVCMSICCCVAFACQSQQDQKSHRMVGGNCEGCEALLEYGNAKLTFVDTLPMFESEDPKLLITGTVYERDGHTPAEGVIIYIYHTDRNGIYTTRHDAVGWAQRHGKFRGWVQTNALGQYAFYTFRPAAYPGRSEPEHIHMTIKEHDTIPYYIDDIVFDDDPLLTPDKRIQLPNRGGSGITNPRLSGSGVLSVERNIVLGKNIPDY